MKQTADVDDFNQTVQSRTLGIRDHRTPKEQRQAYFRHHKLEFVNAWLQLWLTPLSTFLSIFVMGMAIALPITLWTLLDNVKMVTGYWDQGNEITVYFHPRISDERAKILIEGIGPNDLITNMQFISKAEGLSQIETQLGRLTALGGLDENPIPAALKVTPSALDEQTLFDIQSIFRQYNEVDEVIYDQVWFERIESSLAFFDRLLFVFLFGLATLIILVVLTATRLAIHSKAAETKVLRLFGASDAYIRRPFLYAGAWLGFWAAMTALFIASFVIYWMQAPAEQLLSTYMGSSGFQGLDSLKAFQTILLGVGLAWLGSWIATQNYLKAAE